MNIRGDENYELKLETLHLKKKTTKVNVSRNIVFFVLSFLSSSIIIFQGKQKGQHLN